MAKQIKLGFDKIPTPIVLSVEPLYDVNTGVPLKNSAGQPLVTEEQVSLNRFGKSARATSIHINNDSSRSLKVVEQFVETSQVSTSLLGIPKS